MPLADVSSRYADLVESVFSTAIAGKAWLATGAFVLAFVQVLTASRMWGKLERFVPLSFSTSRRIHRWSGRIALLLTIPVIFHCVMILGFETTDLRVTVHSIAGSFIYGVVAAKLLVIQHHSRNYPSWVLPVLGGDARRGAHHALADVEPLVLHERAVRVLMRSPAVPFTVLLVVAAATFALAMWHPFSPSAPPAAAAPPGDAGARRVGLRGDLCRMPRRRRNGRRRPCAARQRADGGRRRGRRGDGARHDAGRARLGPGRWRTYRRTSRRSPSRLVPHGGARRDRPSRAGGDVRHQSRDGRLGGRRPRDDRSRRPGRARGGSADRAVLGVGGVGPRVHLRARRARR